MTIYEKLSIIQSKLKAPKDLRNNFGGFNYRSAESILENVKPLLKENEVVLTLSDSVETLNNLNYIKATATLIDFSGNQISVSAYAREPLSKKGMDDSQISGASSSYARKYALNGLLCIDDTKDSDSEEVAKIEQKTTNNDAKRTELISRGDVVNVNWASACNYYGKNLIEELTTQQIEAIVLAKERQARNK